MQTIGQVFDDPEGAFLWVGNAVFGVAVLNAVNRAGVSAELLKEPATLEDLAKKSGLPAGQLKRMLDFLLAQELIDTDADGHWCANQRTAVVHAFTPYLAVQELSAVAATRLVPGLRQGVTPFELAMGAPVFEYYASHPEEAAIFGEFMGFMTRKVERFIFSQHRFEPFATVADIGGSMGDLVLGILDHYPGTKGILFDRPEILEQARPAIAASPLADRVEIVGGNFFENVPAADLYTLKQILHDWSDEECRHILANIRAAINPGGRLAVIDLLLPDVPEPSGSLVSDLSMMVWDTGRERKRSEFEALFAESGFKLDRITPNPSFHSVIEAVPV